MDLIKDFKKYKWFYTSSDKLVVGGKNADQNDELINRVKSSGNNFLVMHTSSPGSPFSVIISNSNEITGKDKEECGTFTACFSQAWKKGCKKVEVDLFHSNQLYKSFIMKKGTWGINGEVKKISCNLALALTKQKGVLRAVPEKSVKNKKSILLLIEPGNESKEKIVEKLSLNFKGEFSSSEIASALPSGDMRILNEE